MNSGDIFPPNEILSSQNEDVLGQTQRIPGIAPLMDLDYLTASIAPEEQDEASDSEDEKPMINETMLS